MFRINQEVSLQQEAKKREKLPKFPGNLMINDLLRLHLIIMQLVKPKNVKMVVQQNGEGVVVMMTSQRGT